MYIGHLRQMFSYPELPLLALELFNQEPLKHKQFQSQVWAREQRLKGFILPEIYIIQYLDVGIHLNPLNFSIFLVADLMKWCNLCENGYQLHRHSRLDLKIKYIIISVTDRCWLYPCILLTVDLEIFFEPVQVPYKCIYLGSCAWDPILLHGLVFPHKITL